MLFNNAAAFVAVAGGLATTTAAKSVDWANKYTATGTADVAKAAATAKTSSPTSHVKGKAFDRIAIVYFENTDYNKAFHDPNFHFFAQQGLTLSNYYAVTHPSQPNYMASICGDYFGMQNDAFTQVPSNVTTMIDLLEDAGISWAAYQEDAPYSGFEGFSYVNTKTGANDYVRKHNPPVLFNSVANSEKRLSQIKNLSLIDEGKSMFHKDLKANKLPQWMFITPNMTSDAHDTTITVAGKWLKAFMTPLLDDKHFMDNTLVLITFDENENYAIQNNVFAVALGDALPHHLKGKDDDHFYNHYSEAATVQANWGLPSLGRWDVGANIFSFVAKETGDKLRKWKDDELDAHFFNQSYAGVYNSDGGNAEFPAPNLRLDRNFNRRPIAESVKKTWKGSKNPTYYKDTIENNDGLNPPAGYEAPQ